LANLARIRAIAIALKHRAFAPRPEAVAFAAAKAKRIEKYGRAEQMAFHATSLLKKHASILAKRSKNVGAGLQQQSRYVRHVQKSMKKVLKGHASSPYASALLKTVKVRRA
jgi:hypothetical protein